MSTLHIANYFDCDRLSAVAGEAMTPGMIVKVTGNAAGERKLMKLLDADSAQVVAGKYAVVTKEMIDRDEVESSTAASDTGSRIVSIASGDAVLELRKGTKIEYSPDLLDDSLNPGASGALPGVGDALAIKGSKWCASGTGGAIATPVAGRVLRVFGSGTTAKVVIELV